MKKLVLAFLLGAVTTCAGTFIDTVHFTGPDAPAVSSAIADLPVNIEIRETPPAEGLRAYAESKPAPTPGFNVVITTHPRAWYIDVRPDGFVSHEASRRAGEAMVARWRAKDYTGALINVANDLTALTVGVEIVHAAPVTPPEPDNNGLEWALLAGVLVALGVGVFLMFGRSKNKASQAIGNAQLRDPTVTGMRMSSTPPLVNKTITPPSDSRSEKALRYYNRYSAADRRRMLRERAPSSSSSALDDPVMFYLLMNSASSHSSCAPSASSHAVEDDRRRSSPPPTDYSASPSFDSSSSSDSGSSYSDSGGSGGSID